MAQITCQNHPDQQAQVIIGNVQEGGQMILCDVCLLEWVAAIYTAAFPDQGESSQAPLESPESASDPTAGQSGQGAPAKSGNKRRGGNGRTSVAPSARRTVTVAELQAMTDAERAELDPETTDVVATDDELANAGIESAPATE